MKRMLIAGSVFLSLVAYSAFAFSSSEANNNYTIGLQLYDTVPTPAQTTDSATMPTDAMPDAEPEVMDTLSSLPPTQDSLQ